MNKVYLFRIILGLVIKNVWKNITALIAQLHIDQREDLKWVFSIYNIYNRKNASSLYFESEDNIE